jgi:hypothetical protein
MADGALFIAACAGLHRTSKGPIVRESSSEIVAQATAVFPSEVEDATQASLLACQGATAIGQGALLDRLLNKKAASGKPLSEAEIPHIEVQNHVRTLVKSAQVIQTLVRDNQCTVTLAVLKSDVRAVLREAK